MIGKDTERMDETIIIKKSGKGVFLVICIILGMTLLSVFLLFADLMESPLPQIVLRVFAAFSILLYTFCNIFIIKKALSGKPLLTVTSDGILENSTVLSFGFIPWCDIEYIYLDSMMNNVFIEVLLKNQEAYIEKLSGVKKWLARWNLKLGHQPISISLSPSGVSPQDLIGELQRRHMAAQ